MSLNHLKKYEKLTTNTNLNRGNLKSWTDHEFVRLIYAIYRFDKGKPKKIYDSNILFFKYNKTYLNVSYCIAWRRPSLAPKKAIKGKQKKITPKNEVGKVGEGRQQRNN